MPKVTKEQIKKEKSLLKKLIPGWEWLLEKTARKKKIEKEPFPTPQALLKEQKKMVKEEQHLQKLLKPVRQTPYKRKPAKSTKRKSSKKKSRKK